MALRRRTFFLRLLTLGGPILFILLLARRSGWHAATNDADYYQASSSWDPTLHLLIPATSSNSELCKCVLSSHILGYPIPTLINWEDTAATSNRNWSFGGSHIAKITGVLQYLDKEHVAEEDLVLILDGFDTWFQLPPHLLVSRYNSINDDADRRIAERIGHKAVRAEGIHQTILFPAEKVGPYMNRWDTTASYAVPDSTVRKDLYGNGTDGVFHEGDDPVLSVNRNKLRPRWLNSGLMLGPSEDMRRLFQAAEAHVSTMDHKGSDQVIFAQIFGEQSYQREAMRLKYRSIIQSVMAGLQKMLGTYEPSVIEEDASSTREFMDWAVGHPFEFGIGLDYALEISFTNTASEEDAFFLVHDSPSHLESQQRRLASRLRPEPPRVTALPYDLTFGPLPFHALLDGIHDADDDLARMQWAELPLYTNVWTTTVAATIHINGDKELRQRLWADMWYFPRLHALVEARGRTPGDRGPGAFDTDGKFLPWSEICNGTDVDVFRDGDWGAPADVDSGSEQVSKLVEIPPPNRADT